MIPSVLLMVDDDSAVIDALTSSLNRAGLSVLAASDLAGAMQVLRRHAIDLALIEMRLPDAAGLDVLSSILEHDPALPVLMISEFADVRSAVDAIRRGALDVVEKPLDIVDISARIESLVRNGGARRKSSSPVGSDRPRLPPIVESASFREVLAIAKRVAATPMSSALLLGESGVGKEVVATSIHEASERRDGPFVRVNLAAIPATMIEAELFGSVRGAYTDAKRDRAGYFASAEGGTILLDEIGEFKLELQSKLLRAIEERAFYPVGSDRERRMNVRVLASTNREPKQLISLGLFREDLYYRIATVAIRVPPLRERPDDILPLAERFCATYGPEFGRPHVHLGGAAREALMAHRWPGNIRELRNVIERAVMLSDTDEIDARTLDLQGVSPGAATEDVKTLAEVEKQHIAHVLRRVGGSRIRAAALLGVSRSTLWEKTKRLGLT